MIITNLLDKTVKVRGLLYVDKDTIGKVCAVFGENNNGFSVAIIAEDGKLYTCFASQLSIHDEKIYYVLLYWTPDQKIKAIKAVRGVTQISLKEAKELVEENIGKVIVKANLSFEEAHEIKRRITQDDRMECEVRSKLNQ